MTPFLIFTRLAIIALAWCSMLPLEVACDVIDDALERRGVWLG